MCLEEMFQTTIPEGAVFYVSSHRRKVISFTQELRNQVRTTVEKLERIRRSFVIPDAEEGPKCARCSFRELCMPKLVTSAKSYCDQLLKDATKVVRA